MNKCKIGFVGGGAMAEAIVNGIIQAKLLSPTDIYVADHKQDRCLELKEKYDIHADVNLDSFLSEIDILVLAIKPQVAQIAIKEVLAKVTDTTIIVSVVAGLNLATLEGNFKTQPVVRVMPNTPAAVGEGMSAIALGKNTTEETATTVLSLFNAIGKALIVEEKAMDAVTGLSGSGPGYAFVIIDAMADAGVKVGLPRKTAITLAAQTLLGAAKMVLASGEHPAVLRDKVTSPGGTTIAGIHVMEQRGVRAALIDAVEVATEKSRTMGKK